MRTNSKGENLLLMKQFFFNKSKRYFGKSELSRARGYNFFFHAQLSEHEILNAHKYKHTKKFSNYQAQISLEYYFMLINVEMLTTVGTLTFMSRKNFMLS